MDDCPTCPKSKTIKGERSQRIPRKRRYRPVSDRKRRISPMGCEPCSREDLLSPRRPFSYCTPCEPCSSPCRDRCCYQGQPEVGLLNTIRSSIQKIFTGRKSNQLYTYSMSRLKCIERLLDKLENETCCVENTIKRALEYHCNIDCKNLKCSLNIISERVEEVKCDLVCAQDCYDPCRDRCEFDLICCLMDKVCSLEKLLQELCFQLECLEIPPPCDTCCLSRGTYRSNCKKQCCGSHKSPCVSIGCPKSCRRSYCKPECDTGCIQTCCDKPKSCGFKNYGKAGNNCCRTTTKGLCRTSSVIPVGVMLVKL